MVLLTPHQAKTLGGKSKQRWPAKSAVKVRFPPIPIVAMRIEFMHKSTSGSPPFSAGCKTCEFCIGSQLKVKSLRRGICQQSRCILDGLATGRRGDDGNDNRVRNDPDRILAGTGYVKGEFIVSTGSACRAREQNACFPISCVRVARSTEGLSHA